MGELKDKVDASEKALQDYREREHIVDTKGVALSGAGRQLDELTRSLVDARQKRAEAESAYDMVQQVKAGKGPPNYESIPAVLKSPIVQQMKVQEAEAERRLSDAAKRYGPEHPKMIQAKVGAGRRAGEYAAAGRDVVVQGLAREYEAAKSNEAAVANAPGAEQGDIQGMNRKEFQLGSPRARGCAEPQPLRHVRESPQGDQRRRRLADRRSRGWSIPRSVPTQPYAPNRNAGSRHRRGRSRW